MTVDVRLRPEAELDLAQAAEWYEEQKQSLGQEFLDETLAALSTIAGGKLSPKNLLANFVAIKRAVAGLFAKMSSTCSPSEMPPPAGIFTPRTVFSPLS